VIAFHCDKIFFLFLGSHKSCSNIPEIRKCRQSQRITAKSVRK